MEAEAEPTCDMGWIGRRHPKESYAHHRSNVPVSISVHSLRSQHSSMSSFRNHRIVIASLFLPTIAVIEESTPPTPELFEENLDSTISAVTDKLVAANCTVDSIAKSKPLKASIITTNINHHRQPSASSPLKSIVEDLKDKVYVIFLSTTICHSFIVIRAVLLHPVVHRPAKPLIILSQSSFDSQHLPKSQP